MAKQNETGDNNNPSSNLGRGSNVEVRILEDGFIGALFPATILDHPPPPSDTCPSNNNNNKDVLVQYDSLLSDQDPENPLVEHVSVSRVRPSQPEEEDTAGKEFRPGDDVEAFRRDGWWPGVVMKNEGEFYTVGFKEPPDFQVLGRNELRARLNWENGNWSKPTKQLLKQSDFNSGDAIEVNLLKENYLWYSWLPAIYVGQLEDDCFLVQYRKANNRIDHGVVKEVASFHQLRPRPPPEEETDIGLMNMVDAFHDMGWWVGNVTQILKNNKYIVTFVYTKEKREFTRAELRHHKEWIAGNWVAGVVSEQVGQLHIQESKETSSAKRKRSVRKSKCDCPYPSVTNGKKGRSQKLCVRNEVEKAYVLNPCDEIIMNNNDSSGIGPEYEVMEESHAGSSLLPKQDIQQHNEDGLSSCVVKVMGILPESIVEHSDSPAKGSEYPHGDGKSVALGVGDPLGISAKAPDNDQTLSLCIKEVHTVKPMEGSSNPAGCTNLPFVNQMKQSGPYLNKSDGKTSKSMEWSCSEAPTRDGKTKVSAIEVQVDGAGVSAMTPAQDQCFSSCIDQMDSENTVNESSHSDGTSNKQNLVAEAGILRMLPVHDQPSPLSVVNSAQTTLEDSSTLADSPNLPFVKNIPLWENVESMEVFKRFPQKPHFQPLLESQEVFREGSALGKMVAFASLVDLITKLHAGDPRDAIDRSLEAAGELEMHGFDVRAIKHCLTKLLDMKVKLGQLQDQSKAVETKISEINHNRTNDAETICRNEKEIKDIEIKIKDLQEKQAMVVSAHKAKESEVSRLQSEAQVISESIQSIWLDFDTLAAASSW